jgi:hypothetical protein
LPGEDHAASVQGLRARLGEPELQEAWQAGARLTFEQAADLALDEDS